jgi:hypothetical protein
MIDDDLLDVSELKIKNVDEVIKEKLNQAKVLTA